MIIIRRMKPNQIIFLNGPSSSGKSTLAHALQTRLDEPYLYFAEDMFFSALPANVSSRPDFFTYGSRLYAGFTKCVRTLVECENFVVVDTVAWVPGSLEGFVRALWDTEILAVGIHCPLAVLEERERQRANRAVGLARRQYEAVHRDALYDLELDTSTADVATCVDRIIHAMQTPQAPHAFAQMYARLHEKS